MTKALVVCFYCYTPRADTHYKTQGELFFKYAKQFYPFIDALYLVDAGWGFTAEDLHPNTTKITDDYRSHWYYLNELFKLVKEDTFLLVDPDTLIYDPEVVLDGFNSLADYGMTGILDNSGSLDLFPANEQRDVRRRFTPYLTFGHTADFKDRDFTPTQKDGKFEFDSMGKITFDLYKTVSLQELPDDRSSLYLNEDLTITPSLNLDSPSFSWSERKLSPGYYHVRNSSIGLSFLVEYQYDRPAYDRRKAITPFREALRLIAWQWAYDLYTGHLEEWRHTYEPVLADFNVPLTTWKEYTDYFCKYHSWLKE